MITLIKKAVNKVKSLFRKPSQETAVKVISFAIALPIAGFIGIKFVFPVMLTLVGISAIDLVIRRQRS